MKGKIGTGTIALIGAAVVLWIKREEVAAAIKAPAYLAATPEQAKAALAEPTKTAAALDSYVAAHPTSYSVIEQAKAQIAAGTAEPEDIVRFSAKLRAYNEYVKDGGADSFEDFNITHYSTMPAKYKAIIDEAKAANVSARADEVEATSAYYVEYMIGLLSHTNPLWKELAARHPELVSEKEYAVATTKGEAIPAEEVAAAVEQSTVPDGFTASGKQLDELEAADYTKESEVYQHASDFAYVEAAKECTEDKVVTWSSDGGYEAKSSSEIAEEATAAGAEAWTYYT